MQDRQGYAHIESLERVLAKSADLARDRDQGSNRCDQMSRRQRHYDFSKTK